MDYSNTPIDLMVTGRCDEACLFCYGADKKSLELPLGDLKSIIDVLYNTGFREFNIGGGEPTVRKDLVDILSYIKQKEGSLVYLSTNAMKLSRDENLRRALFSVVDLFGLSIDGSNTDMNVAMTRHQNHFNANGLFLEQLSEEFPDKPVKIGTVVSKINYVDVPQIGNHIRQWKDELRLNLLSWRLFQFSPTAEGRENRQLFEDENFSGTFSDTCIDAIAQFEDLNVVARPNSTAENAYFLVLPSGELALSRNGMHEKISAPLNELGQAQLESILESHDDTAIRAEGNRSWLKNV